MENTLSSDERFAWPIKVIVDINDPAVIKAIQNKENMLDKKWEHVRYSILDGQHRQKAAIDLLNGKNKKGMLKSAKEYYWYCDIYRKGVKDVAGLPTLMVALNTPGPSRNSIAADYVRAFASTIKSRRGNTNVKVLFGKRELTVMLVTLYKSRFWQEFFEWSVMPFNQYMGYNTLESWYYYRPEYELLHYLIEDSTRQIQVLYKAKFDQADPLMTADISRREWSMRTTSKTGTYDSIYYHYGKVIESRNTFNLKGKDGKSKFEQFWSLATKGRYIFGDLLWISTDLDIKAIKDENATCGQSSFLVPPMRGAFSILAVLLFGTSFRLDVKGDKPWIESMMKKAGVEYDWIKCKMIIRALMSNLECIKQMLHPTGDNRNRRDFMLIHIEARYVGVKDAMKWVTWSENAFWAWSEILKVCKTVLGVDKDPDAWNAVLSIVFNSPEPLTPAPPSTSATRATGAAVIQDVPSVSSTMTGAMESSAAGKRAAITQNSAKAAITTATTTATISQATTAGAMKAAAVMANAKPPARNAKVAAGDLKSMTVSTRSINRRTTIAEGAATTTQSETINIGSKKRTRDAMESTLEPVTKHAKHNQNQTASTASQPGLLPSLQQEDEMDAMPTAQPQHLVKVESQQTPRLVDEKPKVEIQVTDPNNSEELERHKQNMLAMLSNLEKRVGSLGGERSDEEKAAVVKSILRKAFDRIEPLFTSS